MTAISFPLRRKDFFRPVHLRLSAMIKPLLRRRAVSLLQPDLHIIRDIFQRSGILCGVCPVKVLQRLVPIDFRTETLGIADSQWYQLAASSISAPFSYQRNASATFGRISFPTRYIVPISSAARPGPGQMPACTSPQRPLYLQ